jgi:hypothetical protein
MKIVLSSVRIFRSAKFGIFFSIPVSIALRSYLKGIPLGLLF